MKVGQKNQVFKINSEPIPKFKPNWHDITNFLTFLLVFKGIWDFQNDSRSVWQQL